MPTSITGKPNCCPPDLNKIPDLIDFFVVKNIPANFLQIEEGWDLNSDHSLIILMFNENIIRKENNPVLVNKMTDWISFRQREKNQITSATERFNN